MKSSLALAVLMSVMGLSACQLKPETNQMVAVTEEEAIAPAWIAGVSDTERAFFELTQVPMTGSLEQAKAAAQAQALQQLNQRLFDEYLAQYERYLLEERADQGSFEQQLRQKIREGLKPEALTKIEVVDVYVDQKNARLYLKTRLSRLEVQTQLAQRLILLDNRLQRYLHVSDSGGSLKQFMALLPVLPTLEERRILQRQLGAGAENAPRGKDTVTMLMDRQISKLVDQIVLNLEASTDDSSVYALRFKHAFEAEGMNMTARIPDLVLKYYLEPEDISNDRGLYTVVMLADIDIVDNQGSSFVRVSDTFQGTRRFQSDAEDEALGYIAQATTQAIMQKMLEEMNEVNRILLSNE